MAIVYGVSGAFSKATSKTFEKLLVADKNGVTTTILSKYVRTETATETVGTTFGAGAIGSDDVLNATITAQVDEQLKRTPYPYPTLHIQRKPASLFDYQFDDFEVRDYQCHPSIKAPVSV